MPLSGSLCSHMLFSQSNVFLNLYTHSRIWDTTTNGVARVDPKERSMASHGDLRCSPYLEGGIALGSRSYRLQRSVSGAWLSGSVFLRTGRYKVALAL
jgi:hypothetical protein